MNVLYVSPTDFVRSPQIGTACEMDWDELAHYLARASVGDAKHIAGAWSPALYTGNLRRKASLIRIEAAVFDFDDNGDVDEVATLLSKYRLIVHETFSSTHDAPRCRAIIELAEPIDAATYEALHRVVRAHLGASGFPADEGAKDASRLSYAPVRRPDAGYRFQRVNGIPLDARVVLAAQPPPPPRPPPPEVRAEHRDRYVQGALRRAADEVAKASPGARHYALCKEAFTLARLDLGAPAIESALLPGFVHAAGPAREHEGRRTIADAVKARRGAA